MNISVVICCYNSESRIKQTLLHIIKQRVENLDVEVILVDNNCQDDTTKIAKQIWEDEGCQFKFKMVNENKAGLSNARKKGINEASGEIILFCDDDNWLHEKYLITGYNIMKKDINIGVLGGRSYSIFEKSEPIWFSTYQANFAVGVQNICSGDISYKGFVWGAGCFIWRKTILDLFSSGFDFICSDRKETELSSGGDSELCKWHLLVGKKLWYDENLIFGHYMEEKRMTIDYFNNLLRGFESSSYILEIYDNIIGFYRRDFTKWQRLKQKLILQIKKLLFYRNRQVYLNKLQLYSNSKIIDGSNPKYFSIISATIKFRTISTEC